METFVLLKRDFVSERSTFSNKQKAIVLLWCKILLKRSTKAVPFFHIYFSEDFYSVKEVQQDYTVSLLHLKTWRDGLLCGFFCHTT